MELIEKLIQEGWLKTPEVISAFKKIKRVDFLPDDIKDLAELNEALPISFGQTISQPLVVAFMLELLEPKEGEKILDIGSGSGWTSALLGEIVGEKLHTPPPPSRAVAKGEEEDLSSSPSRSLSGPLGKVIAIDIVPELVEFGKKNVGKYNFVEKGIVEFICSDGSKGYEKEAPFDKILVSATAIRIPDAWKKQLKVGGRIVTPINSSIWLFIKKSFSLFDQIEYPGFVFVPLISSR